MLGIFGYPEAGAHTGRMVNVSAVAMLVVPGDLK
jgi:hypothetical protein